MPASTLSLEPIAPLSRETGFPLKHPYVEHVYAPVVGPTSVLVLRRAGLLFEAFPEGVQLDAEEFAASLGVGHRGGTNSPVARTFTRLDRFSLASWDPEIGTLAVPTQVRPVPDRWLRRLPESTRAVHASMISSLDAPALRTEAPVVTPGPALSMGLGR